MNMLRNGQAVQTPNVEQQDVRGVTPEQIEHRQVAARCTADDDLLVASDRCCGVRANVGTIIAIRATEGRKMM